MDAALVKPLPFADSDRLVRIYSTSGGATLRGISRLDARDLAASARSFEGIAVHDRWRKNVAGIGGWGDPEETAVGLAPGAFFRLLGVKPLLGRLFTPQEDVYGNHYVAAIDAALWRTRFGSDPEILRRTLRINGETYAIVSVLPDAVPGWMTQPTPRFPSGPRTSRRTCGPKKVGPGETRSPWRA